MEKRRGQEALVQSPFKDIALKHTDAVNKLNQRSIVVFSNNLKSVITSLDSMSPEDLAYKDLLEIALKEDGQPTQEDLLMLNETVSLMLNEAWGNLTLKKKTTMVMDQIFPKVFKDADDSRSPNNICLEYLLDMLRVIDPKVAGFGAGVRVMIEGIRESKFMPQFLKFGVMTDSLINRRGTGNVRHDLYADVEAASQFKKYVLRFADPKERLDFEAGLNSESGVEWGVERFSFSHDRPSAILKLPKPSISDGAFSIDLNYTSRN